MWENKLTQEKACLEEDIRAAVLSVLYPVRSFPVHCQGVNHPERGSGNGFGSGDTEPSLVNT